MKKILFLLTIVSFFAFSQAIFAQANYKTYRNARYGFSISYPSALLKPQGEADNGDGQIFTGTGAEMRVFGSNMLLNETLLKEFNALIKSRAGVTYKTRQRNFFVVSAISDGKIFYQKTIARKDGSYITFMIEYDESKRAVYDKAVTRMVKSFR